jgi:repressor LexA
MPGRIAAKRHKGTRKKTKQKGLNLLGRLLYICLVKHGISSSQARVLAFLRREVATRGSAPTYREIAAEFGWKSPKAAVDHVARLARKGYLRVHRGRARGIEVLDAPANVAETVVPVPIRGSIAAGLATEASEDWAGRVLVDKAMLGRAGRGRLFAVRVTGDSMTGRGINEGDIAIAQAEANPHDGDIVVALIDNESTLKTLAQGPHGSFLKAENSRYPDLFPVAELTIQGVVRALIRKVG